MTEVPRQNAVTRWTELHLSNPNALTPAVPLYVPGSRQHRQINIISRDLFTYEGTPTSYDRVVRGRMYIVLWFGRWTMPFLNTEQSIRFDPASRPLGSMQRLLCVADR